MTHTKVENQMGQNGGVYVTGTSATPGEFCAIQALEATVIASLTSVAYETSKAALTGTLTSIPLPAGVTIYGNFTTFTLTSGKVIAYNRV